MMEKKKKIAAGIGAALVVGAFCGIFWQITEQRKEIQSLQHQMSAIEDSISEIGQNTASQVEAALKTQASIVDSSSYELKKVNTENCTVDVLFSVVPKEIDEQTQVFIAASGKTVEMEKKEGQKDIFEASIPFSIFDTLEDTRVILQKGGSQKTESLDYYESLSSRVLPGLCTEWNGSTGVEQRKEKNTYFWEGTLSAYQENHGEDQLNRNKLSAIALHGAVDGKVAFKKAFASDFEKINERVNVKPGQTVTLYVTAKDQLGFRYRVFIDKQRIDKDGQIDYSQEPVDWSLSEVEVLDAKGKVLGTMPQYM